MIAAAEALFGPYRWGRYDLLVLPPSFPFGGMENPRLTFATPTILAGDKSLVVAGRARAGAFLVGQPGHQRHLARLLAERRLHRLLRAADHGDRSTARSARDLEKQLARERARERAGRRSSPGSRCCTSSSAAAHPDDGFSGVPYEKGALFLRRLEAAVRPRALRRLPARLLRRARLPEHHHRATSSPALQQDLLASDPAKAAQPVDLDRWLNKPGLPADAPAAASPASRAVDGQRQRFAGRDAGRASWTRAGWVTQQWQHFIEDLPADVAAAAAGRARPRLRLHRERQQRDPVATGWCWPSSAATAPPTPGWRSSC